MLLDDMSLCTGCYACVSICPKHCIQMKENSEGFWYPEVDVDSCIDCGLCEKSCPIRQDNEKNTHPTAYMATNKDTEIRLKSSSGGIFTLLAQTVLNRGGVVFGAAFTKDFKGVEHIAVSSSSELYKLQGSKYLQSKIGNAFFKAKELLEMGTPVLFTGTPCQIGGLYSFLNKSYENLITQDCICHGVPSPMVWRKYLASRENSLSSIIKNVFFRAKHTGWKEYSLLLEFENGKQSSQSFYNDWYMQGFLNNLYLRESCYRCSFKSLDRQSDITLADFWGIEAICPSFDDDKGTSLVLVNSDKGRELWLELNDRIHSQRVQLEKAIAYNSAAIRSASKHPQRAKFFKRIQRHSVDASVKKFLQSSILKKVQIKTKRIIKRIIKR